MRYDNFIPQPRFVQIHSHGRLPHWQVDEAVYFVIFRLRDSLPREIARELLLEHERLMRDVAKRDRPRLEAAFSLRLDTELDRCSGSCLLRDQAEVVANAIRYFDRTRYELHAWCVMPNHVHVMLYLDRGADLPKILHSWKSYTAHQIGRGPIWQREYFDRIVRTPQEYSDTKAYIHANPGKAGLREWPWVG